MSERIAVIGLGYVGLPLAIELAKKYPDVLGFDIDQEKVAYIRLGIDQTGELAYDEVRSTTLMVSADPSSLVDRTMYIVAVPTPVDDDKSPDFGPLESACVTVGQAIRPGAVVCFESTVFPGVTEEICGPIIADVSGLEQGVDFKLAYSPERINPGDKEHTLSNVVKIVSGQDEETLERVAAVYEQVAPIHKAPTIRVAESAKVIENIQRDVNIALMNELAQLFNRTGINTQDVLEAAGTKWNFLKFTPGLVGGHCVGVDPYYLMMLGESVGKPLRLVSMARRVNEGMPKYVAKLTVDSLRHSPRGFYAGARVGVLGYTFKENVKDVRNTKVKDLVKALKARDCEVMVHDPVAAWGYSLDKDLKHTCVVEGQKLYSFLDMLNLDAVIVAVAHDKLVKGNWFGTFEEKLSDSVARGGVVIDLKGVVDGSKLRSDITLITV